MNADAAIPAMRLGPVFFECRVCGRKHYSHKFAWEPCALMVIERVVYSMPSHPAMAGLDFVFRRSSVGTVHKAHELCCLFDEYFSGASLICSRYPFNQRAFPFRMGRDFSMRLDSPWGSVSLAPSAQDRDEAFRLHLLEPWIVAADPQSVERKLKAILLNAAVNSTRVRKLADDCVAMSEAAKQVVGENVEAVEDDRIALRRFMELEFARQAIAWSDKALAAVAELRQAAADLAQPYPAVVPVA